MSRHERSAQNRKKMTNSAELFALFADSSPQRGPRGAFVAPAVSATALPGTAEARRLGAYDGTWNVVFATRRGNCSSGHNIPFTVSGNRVSSAGGGKVSGTVARGGNVSVAVSVGASHASGTGRLTLRSGAGRWSGIITGDRCSGTWQAMRS
jgi:hypothetical protein